MSERTGVDGEQMTRQLTADPTSIPTLVADKDAGRVAAAIEAKYGFMPPAAYCADLAAFVLAMTAQIDELEQQIQELR